MTHTTIDGEDVPSIGLGTWQFTGNACQQGVSHALELGYRHIDTAQAYENETQVGKGLAAAPVPRDEVFLTSKVWRTNVEYDDVIESTHESLRRLDTDYIDLMLIHWPVPEVPTEATLDALQELQQQQKIRYFGVSNFTTSQTREALDHSPIFCNQVEFHPYLNQPELVELAEQHDFLVTAYSPLARGELLGDPTLESIGGRYGKSAAQISLRWLTQKDRVAAIPKAASPEHREANFDIFDFELTPDEIKTVDELDRGHRLIDPSFAPDWDT